MFEIEPEPLTVVAILGPSGVGRGTAALGLAAHRGCVRVAMDDGVKSAFDDLDGPTRQLTKELGLAGVTHRRAWQLLGTEARILARNRRLWASLALAKILYLHRYHPEPRSRFVIPDFRSDPVEESVFRARVPSLGGRFGILGLDRPGAAAIPEADHESERAPGEMVPDRVYVNDGSLESLYQAACLFFDDLEAGRIVQPTLPALRRAPVAYRDDDPTGSSGPAWREDE
jgi:hypothetical protein